MSNLINSISECSKFGKIDFKVKSVLEKADSFRGKYHSSSINQSIRKMNSSERYMSFLSLFILHKQTIMRHVKMIFQG